MLQTLFFCRFFVPEERADPGLLARPRGPRHEEVGEVPAGHESLKMSGLVQMEVQF